MITFMDSKEKLKESERCLDPQLWHACAGSMVQMPPANSKIFYFPQGHVEHASGNVEFRNCPRVPPYITCRVSAVKFMADPETDEVYAKIKLIPLNGGRDFGFDDGSDTGTGVGSDGPEKPASFAKTLTQSDANNGGGFSVPRYCAETIFPRLDYSADPPVQTILAKDVHGETWKFRHIYRGTPRRHLLTTGWSTFVNHKKLVAGDSIVFLRAENGDLCVGIRRAKRGYNGGPDLSSGWNSVMPFGGYSAFPREDDNRLMRNGGSSSNEGGYYMGKGRVSAESVFEAATLAAKGQPFEVVYYPRASTPEFCVKSSLVKTALQIRWCAGMRFKMPFETEDSSRISWFMGTIASVQVADPIRWPDSPWRLLQVTWDEPDLLQNVKRVSPWLVEVVSNMPTIHLSPFSPPWKKLRFSQQPDFPLDSQIPMPTFCGGTALLGPTSSSFTFLPENGSTTPAGMQGARHAHYGLSLSDIHLHKLHSGLFPTRPLTVNNPTVNKPSNFDSNVSCLLTMGNSTPTPKKPDNQKLSQFLLFGQPILTEQQISLSCSANGNSSSEGNRDKMANSASGSGCGSGSGSGSAQNQVQWHRETEPNLETGHCKVFMESEDVGQTIDLSLLGSYEDLCRKLAEMFGMERSEILNHVRYRDIAGVLKQIGEEPFSDFMKTVRRLTILTDSSSDNVGM